jgi:hypothetical protein
MYNLNERRKIMPYSIEQLKNWCMRLGNAGHFASLSILISCFLSLFLLHAELAQAAIVVSPSSVNVTVTTVQTDPIIQTISIVDDGQNTFSWTASWDQDWMELDTLSGQNATSYSTKLTIRPEGLTEGTHNGTITIYTASGNLTVSVTLNIQAPSPTPGQVRVTPESVHVTAITGQIEPITRTIHLFDDNHANFGWTASWDQDWMELDTPTGAGSSSYALLLAIRPEGLTEGTHNGTITIYTASGNLTVSVTLDIQAQPSPPPPASSTPPVKVVVSPSELQFYVAQEQLTYPDPIMVWVNGFATDDGCATTTFSQEQENVEFAWIASKSANWIILNGNPDSIVKNTHGNGSFTVGVDINQLLTNQNIYGGNVTIYDGEVTVTLSDDAHTIPVRVYVNALRYAAEKSLVTTDWLDLIMNVPVMEDISGALYVLAEHPSLAPGQVFAYIWDDVNGPHFDLFSQWGHLVPGAEDLFYVENIQDTPIAIPFSSDEYPGNPVIPYAPTNVAGTDQTPNIKAYIPITFGGGLRLIGMEGDWIIRAIVGDSNDITNWQSWRELLYYVLHIRPVTGTWVVTEEFEGESYTYIDDTGTIYPMILYEERGDFSGGVWISPVGRTPLIVTYGNSADQICKTLAIQGHRLDVSSCVQPGGYEVYFVEPSIWGNVEYLYKITTLDAAGGGYLEGTWQYRFAGEANLSRPENFSAVRQEVVIPLDPSCNCYLVNGTVNGYAVGFIVDTGASMVLLSADEDDASYMGVDLTDLNQCPYTGIGSGVGSDISVTYCYVDIEIEERLSKNNLLVGFSDDWSGPGLLGMTFLDTFHISTNAEDGTMIIAP